MKNRFFGACSTATLRRHNTGAQTAQTGSVNDYSDNRCLRSRQCNSWDSRALHESEIPISVHRAASALCLSYRFFCWFCTLRNVKKSWLPSEKVTVGCNVFTSL